MKNQLLCILISSLLVIGFCENAIADLNDGLVAYYPFNGNALDASGNGNDGVVHGTILTSDRFGKTNRAYNFDGSSYIELTDFPVPETFSVSLWVNPTTVNITQSIIAKHDSSGENIFIFGLWNNTGDIKYHVRVRSDTTELISATAKLQHLVVIIEKIALSQSQISVYRDGDLIIQETINDVIGNPIGKGWVIGQDWDNKTLTDFFNGTIDDVRIYNRTLSRPEIQELYQKNKKPPVAITALSPKKRNPPTYIWNAVSNSSWYFLWVNDSSGNKIKKWYTAAQAGCPNGTGICSVVPNTPLANGSAIWWVRTWNNFGYGAWNSASYFNVAN